MTYCPSGWIIGYLIPCSHKDPVGIKVQPREVLINVLCSLLQDRATGVLVVVDVTVCSIVQVCPEGGDDVSGPIQWKLLRDIRAPWNVKCQMSVVVHLK